MYILIPGILMSAILIILGLLVWPCKKYYLIAGFNTASEEEKKEYKIDALAKHLGNSLCILGALLLLCAFTLYFWLIYLSAGFMLAFIIYSFATVIKGQKYLPKYKKDNI